MKCNLLVFGLMLVSGNTLAVTPINPAGFLPVEMARPLLEQDPGVAAARASMAVAQQEANILDKSPYEWTARTSGQQRNLDSGQRFNEWNVGIERTIRLPGKAAADRNIGRETIEESRARYGEALHEAARELMRLTIDWLVADKTYQLTQTNLLTLEKSLLAVEKRVLAGDAAKLDLSIARAELAEQQRLNNDAKTQVSATWQRLSHRFPGIRQQGLALPDPIPVTESMAYWQERILLEDHALKTAQIRMKIAQAQADRARVGRVPDPTFGVFAASEFGGQERISGISISIPIPGAARSSGYAKSIAQVDVAREEIENKKRQLNAEIASAVVMANGDYDSAQIANQGALAMQHNADMVQRAYVLGEADLQTVLLARRQSTAAINNALQAQAAALKGYYGLLVDAHLMWDMEPD